MSGFLFLAAVVATPMLDIDPTVLRDDSFDASLSTRSMGAYLAWPRGTSLHIEDNADEMVVRSSQGISEDAVASFRASAGDRLQELRWNDDSLLLRATPGQRIIPRLEGSALFVDFAAAPIDTAAQDAAPRPELAVMAVRVDLAAGYAGAAQRKAMALADRYTDDREVTRLLGETYLANGDTQSAARLFHTAGAQDLPALRVMASAPGSVSAGATIRDGTGFSQMEWAAKGVFAIDDAFLLSAGLRRIATRADSASTALGFVTGIDTSATMADVSVGTRIAPYLRLELSGSTRFDDGVTGGGARLIYGPPEGQVRFMYSHHMPDLSSAEQAIGNGFLSQIVMGGTFRLSPEMQVQVDGGRRRYGVGSTAGAAETFTLTGGIDYILSRGVIFTTLSYRIDAEYISHLARAPGGAILLPFSDRENHTVQAFFSGTLSTVQLTSGVGWTKDRFGGDGPNLTAAMAAPFGRLWQVDASGGLSSVSRQGFSGQQIFGRVQVTRALGSS